MTVDELYLFVCFSIYSIIYFGLVLISYKGMLFTSFKLKSGCQKDNSSILSTLSSS